MAVVKEYPDVNAQAMMDGVSMRVVIGPDDGAPVFNLRVFDVEPGFETPHHRHWWEHEVFVLSGSGELHIDSGSIPLRPGCAVLVERNERHKFVNTGQEIFRFICLVPQEWLEFRSRDA